MKIYKLFLLVLALASLACLETAVLTESAPSAAVTPPLTESSLRSQEPESGAVYQLVPTEEARPDPICATVTANKALHLRAEPSEKSRVITWLYAGQVVRIIRKESDWWMVEAGSIVTGYARADYLKESECK